MIILTVSHSLLIFIFDIKCFLKKSTRGCLLVKKCKLLEKFRQEMEKLQVC